MRIAIVSDTHLSPRALEAQKNWGAVVRYVAATGPDVVLHLGDLSLDGISDPDELRHARGELDRLRAPWHVVPGNHDVGDNHYPGLGADAMVDDERRGRWLDIVGPDHFCLHLAGWTLLAINAQLVESGLEAEQAQWRWLEDQLDDRRGSGERLALLTHKPLTASVAELAAAPPGRFIPENGRQRLQEVLAGRRLALVISGHVHQLRLLELDGTKHVWAPTTWAVLPESSQPTLGSKRCGIVTIDLEPDGTVEPKLVEPDGLVQLTLRDHVADPHAPHAA